MNVEARVPDPHTPGRRGRLIAVAEVRSPVRTPKSRGKPARWSGVRAEVVSGGSYYAVEVEAAGETGRAAERRATADTWREAQGTATDLMAAAAAAAGIVIVEKKEEE